MLEDYLRRHDGVLTLAHARLAGVSQDAVNRRLRSGLWLRCSPGVYFVDDRPFTDSARIRAAVWGLGESATGSGLTAAWWHGLTKFAPEVVEVTVPRVSNHRVGTECVRDGATLVRRTSSNGRDFVSPNLHSPSSKPPSAEAAAPN